MTSLSISHHRDTVLESFKKVINGKSDGWVLFGYDNNSKSELTVKSEGEDGLDEIYSEFSTAQIQYGIIKVQCPKSSLDKIVLVNWQGEGVSGIFKGRAANHIKDIHRLFRGIHMTIHARSEDDVDPELIQKGDKHREKFNFFGQVLSTFNSKLSLFLICRGCSLFRHHILLQHRQGQPSNGRTT